jgi:hypothetical protein
MSFLVQNADCARCVALRERWICIFETYTRFALHLSGERRELILAPAPCIEGDQADALRCGLRMSSALRASDKRQQDTTVLGGLAEFERHLILSRTAEERTRAQVNRVRFGRKPSLTPYQRAEALRRRAAGETLASIAQLFGVSHMTIARLGSA